MFILSLSYKVPLDEVERLSAAHMDWVKDGYDRGLFVASGRKVPRTGGVILARGNRAEIEAFLARDPFVIENVADCEITEVAFSRAAAGLAGLTEG